MAAGSDEMATRVERPPTAARTAPLEPAKPGSATVTAQDALRLDEVGRFRRMTYPSLMLALAIVIALLPFLPGDPLAAKIFVAGIAVYAVGATWLRWKVRDPDEWRERNLMVIAACGGAVVLGVIYYWGPFSFAPMLIVASVYVTANDGGLPHAVLTYVLAAAIQAVLAIGIMTGSIADRGLFVSASVPLSTLLATQVVIQGMLFGALIGGRTTRRITLESMIQADRVARETAKREAFIDEIRNEMQRAAGVNRQGRFSDQTVGSFRLGLVLGRGGMGEVYEAHDKTKGTQAAVKLLLVSHLGDAQYLERFAREARAAAALDSPHVVKTLEVGTALSGIPYLAMERLEGSELAALLQERRNLSIAEVVELVEQIAKGLDAARLAGIVHRDIKPHNVFWARQPSGGSVWKILDFGVSKLAEHDGTLTKGQVIGTPSYMAPEQAKGDDVDHRADVYGLAAVAYRSLTGRAPFSSRDIANVIHDVVYRMPPRPSSFANLPSAIDTVLAIALCKDPSDRFATAVELAAELRKAGDGSVELETQQRAAAILRAHPWS
ncbi:MAG TPA: serine/threonine-protein kinase [Kofleriaceae bacterium]